MQLSEICCVVIAFHGGDANRIVLGVLLLLFAYSIPYQTQASLTNVENCKVWGGHNAAQVPRIPTKFTSSKMKHIPSSNVTSDCIEGIQSFIPGGLQHSSIYGKSNYVGAYRSLVFSGLQLDDSLLVLPLQLTKGLQPFLDLHRPQSIQFTA
ncbi:uncharacterized protein BJ212DRAFT_911398 [Suillus subaureus]|uniref:Uncharacterized protein n=1 Tax=Suillus subaureus TaxID=48587 RepID=A0A9P7EI07_9AGAM|nr:uncharacterized protein BJ212DRAFT_911398 [Suillus subaureus]KAG1821627.1 hypothetical protein BJ212DRAFT_911398 [Suillus subaureus]